jgi:hypothetical protein
VVKGPLAYKVTEAGLGQPARVQGSGPWTSSGHYAAWENCAALSFPQRGKAVKALTPKVRPFCDRQVGELREWNMWFPALRSPSSLTCGPHSSSPLTGCQSMGTQECTKWAFPAAMAPPESTTGNPPHPRHDPNPAPRHAGSLLPWSLPSCKGDPRAQLGPQSPLHDTTPTVPPGLAPPLARSGCFTRAPGEPCPHARFQERLSDLFHLLLPGETRGQVNLPRWFSG